MKEQKVDLSHCELPNIFRIKFNIQKRKGGLEESFRKFNFMRPIILFIFSTQSNNSAMSCRCGYLVEVGLLILSGVS